MAVDKVDALNAWRRSLGAPEPSAPEGPGALMTALDYLGRPYSAVMGGLYGAISPELSPGEAVGQALRGDRYFSAYDFAVEAGADPDSKLTRWGSLAADVVNPLDPVAYVGMGWTKAGKAAKLLPEGSAALGKITTRAEGAAKGVWSPIKYMGKPLVPKAVAVPVARAVDAAGNRVSKSKYIQGLGRYVGGVRKLEAAAPGFLSMVRRAERAVDVDAEQFAKEMVGLKNMLVKRGLTEAQADQTLVQATSLLENPQTRLARMQRELELVEGALDGKFTDWLPPGIPADEAEAITRVNFANQRAVDRRVGELRLARGELKARAEASGPRPEAPSSALAPEAMDPEMARAISLQDSIIERYLSLSGGKLNQRVRLKDLRPKLGRTRAEQDAALLEMQRRKQLVLYRLDDPLDTSDADRAAALMLDKDTPRHLVYMGPEAIAAQERRMGLGAAPKKPSGDAALWDDVAKVEDELHVLQSVQEARFARDMPPQDVLMARREALQGEISHVRKLWDDAGPEVLEVQATLSPLLKATRDLYEDVLRKYDADFEFPVEDYIKHMFPAHYSRLPQNVVKASEAAKAEKARLAAELAGKGLDDVQIEAEIRRRMGDRAALADMDVSRRDFLKGDLDAFKQREYQMTIEQFNKFAQEGGLDARFENYSTTIAQAMRRDATRWRYAHDIHKYVLDKPGWTMKGEDYAKLGKADQANWERLEFHVPWIDPKKNPFRDVYVKRDIKELMGSQIAGMGRLLTDEGMNGMLGVLNAFRQWWVSWTLAPFPSTRMRDLVSDIVLANQAGLNPVADLAKMPFGESAYGASLALNVRRSNVPMLKGLYGEAPKSLDNLLAKINAKFPDSPLTEEKLVEYLEIEGVLGASAVRDLDLKTVLSNDPAVSAARGQRRFLEKAHEWTPLRLDVSKSKWVKGGFAVAQAQADFTRGALFIDTLTKILPEAKSLDDAMLYATAAVRRHLYDYLDLTRFERDVLKNVVPFYTFTAKNLPLQLTEAATNPGKFAWVNRMYQSAWGTQEEQDIRPEDLPDWLDKQMGLPLHEIETGDGVRGWAVWTPRGWLPQTELNEMAALIRGELGGELLARLSPLLKEPVEQMLNRDAFTMREIEDGTIRDIGGIPVNRRVAHLLNNLRLVGEIDRIDPGGLWTKVGQHMGWWEGERPHRYTAPGPERAVRFFSGLNIKGVAPVAEAERRMRDSEREMNSSLSRARWAIRKGQTYEAEKFLQDVQRLGEQQRESAGRLNELRRRNALVVQQRESG